MTTITITIPDEQVTNVVQLVAARLGVMAPTTPDDIATLLNDWAQHELSGMVRARKADQAAQAVREDTMDPDTNWARTMRVESGEINKRV